MPSPAVPEASRLSAPLSDLLMDAARCVRAVEQGQSLSEALPQVSPDRRPGAQAIVFLALRRLGTARAVARRLASRPPAPPLRALLHTALALLIGGDDAGGRYNDHTVVDQAVHAAKRSREMRMQAGFLNACLRRFLREREVVLADVQDDVEAVWNHPRWWVERLQHDHPEHWPQILRANNQPGPMVLRVNRRRGTRDAYRERLLAEGLVSQPLGEDGLVLATPQPVDRLPGFADGLSSVQDGAAQCAAPLLLSGRAWAPGARVLDACAAPGGKTAHLLEHADLDLLALDVDPQRCRRIDDTLRRLGLRAEVRTADAGDPGAWWDGRPFDGILLDAPCTAAGIVRRHPDIRWLRRPGDVAQLAAVQRRLLDTLWPLLRPGGRLVYCTCSVFRAEGAEQVAAFLSRHNDARVVPSVGHLLPENAGGLGDFNDNESGGYDGFFYACMDKRS